MLDLTTVYDNEENIPYMDIDLDVDIYEKKPETFTLSNNPTEDEMFRWVSWYEEQGWDERGLVEEAYCKYADIESAFKFIQDVIYKNGGSVGAIVL